MNENEKKQERSVRLTIYYYVIAISIVLLINWFLFPALTGTKVVEAEYSQFLQQIDDNQVSMVEIQNDHISLQEFANCLKRLKRRLRALCSSMKLTRSERKETAV